MKMLICKVALLFDGANMGSQFWTTRTKFYTKEEVEEILDAATDVDEIWEFRSLSLGYEDWRLMEEHLEEEGFRLGGYKPSYVKLLSVDWSEPDEWGWREYEGDTYTGYDSSEEAYQAAIDMLTKQGYEDPEHRIDGPFPIWEGEAAED